ncbi:hypothetical protein SERLADRAFT_442726 [Serpula lacrymans var. lacrymans S7.9]|uniref:Uncharacterized protein n=1 Tax=Serpula lacrymans var. lacrymans (strain S7.9) TaxID=578457 RepID=F8PAS3_SERL9|nr:uncharacterized protein SERLADRAFT_442726 [Serpula lacrymans var. lacrymans S7.9]EGO19911.1 hypothetical protein SERLADRAFT_442726 [Serpula lacrymans var. lacrymans S7.9]
MEGVVYALAMRTLTFKGKPLFIFIVSVTLFVLSSAHLILNAVHVGTCCKEDDTSKCNSVLSHRIYTAKYAIYVAQTCAADGFVIWRSRLFSRTCIIAVPALLWVASFAVGITGTCFISKAEPNISAIFSSPCRPWMICFYVLTYSSHFSGTAILIIRVWSLFHPRTNLFEASRKLCRRVVMLLTGAHGLYAITIIALLVCYLCRTLGQVVVADMLWEQAVPIISIAHCMTAIPGSSQQEAASKGIAPHYRVSRDAEVKDDLGSTPTAVVMHSFHFSDFTMSARLNLDEKGERTVTTQGV